MTFMVPPQETPPYVTILPAIDSLRRETGICGVIWFEDGVENGFTTTGRANPDGSIPMDTVNEMLATLADWFRKETDGATDPEGIGRTTGCSCTPC